MSVSGQFQVFMALLEIQCECCVVRVTLCVCVCVCVLRETICMPVRKSRWVFVCVSSVCVFRDHVCEYVRSVPSVDGSAGDPV